MTVIPGPVLARCVLTSRIEEVAGGMSGIPASFHTGGVASTVGNTVLVYRHTTPSQNGLWVIQDGAWTRDPDFNEPSEMASMREVVVREGSMRGRWMFTNSGVPIIGSTPLNFQFYAPDKAIVPKQYGGITPDFALEEIFPTLSTQGYGGRAFPAGPIFADEHGRLDDGPYENRALIQGLGISVGPTSVRVHQGHAVIAREEVRQQVWFSNDNLTTPHPTTPLTAPWLANSLVYLYAFGHPDAHAAGEQRFFSNTTPVPLTDSPLDQASSVYCLPDVDGNPDLMTRYLATFRTDGSGRIVPTSYVGDGSTLFVGYTGNSEASPYRIVTGYTSNVVQTKNLSAGGENLIPPSAQAVHLRVASGGAHCRVGVVGDGNVLDVTGGSRIFLIATQRVEAWVYFVPGQPRSIQYRNNPATGGSIDIDVLGYIDRR